MQPIFNLLQPFENSLNFSYEVVNCNLCIPENQQMIVNDLIDLNDIILAVNGTLVCEI